MSKKKSKKKQSVVKVSAPVTAPKKKGITDYNMGDIQTALRIPPRAIKAFETLKDVKERFSLPVTLGAPKKEREALDLAFDSIGGFDTIHSSLLQHAFDMGEFPVTTFLGYGVLQQIAQNGMIRACVQTVADDITREWIEIKGGEDSDAETVKKLQDAQESKYHLRRLFNQAAATTGFMGGCLIFIDTGVEDKNLELPLKLNNECAEIEKGKPIRFQVIDPINVSPGEYNADRPLEPDYMKPKYWWVLGKKVHASRLIALYDNPPPMLLKPAYNFLGIPQAQILWDYVLHWNDCRVYTADLLKKVSLLVVQTDTDSIFGEANGIQKFDIRMKALERYRDNNSVFVCDKTEEAVSNVQTSIAGCTDVVRQALEMIAAINRTPAVKLLGISPSGFNATGESDITNYYDHIRSKQELRRDAINRCLKAIQLSIFGQIDKTISFDFVELAKEDENQKAMTAASRAQTLATLTQVQAINAEEVREAVKNDKSMDLGFLSDEMPDMGDPEDFMPESMGGDQESLDEYIQRLQGGNQQEIAKKDDESLDEFIERLKSQGKQQNPPDEKRQLMQEYGL